MLQQPSRLFLISLLFSSVCAAPVNISYRESAPPVCTVQPNPHGGDDAPAILTAFNECGYGGKVIFGNHTYHVNSVMYTTGLRDCEVELWGTLLWSNNTSYWLKRSMPIGYQNQSTVWFFGGTNITFNGFGQGTFDGNGQVWYDLVDGISNYPHRPQALTIWKTMNSIFQGIRFVQSQMWTVTTIHCSNVLLQDIYVNSTSNSKAPARNTDGADTIVSDNIIFRRWSVDNGDDGIAVKANSSNILIEDSVFRRGQGIAVGSIGQYPGQYEFVENFTARNITTIGTHWAGYMKTWTGVEEGYPPNGGGGGIGYIKNITWHDFTMISNSGVLDITQCTSFSGQTRYCNTSTIAISDVNFGNMHGTVIAGVSRLGKFSCSAAKPCHNITIGSMDVHTVGTGAPITGYSCTAVQDIKGFTC